MRLRIEYFDQNESFAAQLPREGVVVAQPKSSDRQLSWHLVHLDISVTYEEIAHTHLLLASRWAGYPLGTTSVFILLVPPSHATVADGFSYKRYVHVAWGMSHVIGA